MTKRRSSSVAFQSTVVVVTGSPRSRHRGTTDRHRPAPESNRRARAIIWVDCPHCYGFGTSKMEWGEFYQTCLECNGNGLLEAEQEEDEQPQI